MVTHDLKDPNLSYSITNTQLDTQSQNKNLIPFFLNDMSYTIKKGDMKSDRYNFIKQVLQPQLRSGFNQYSFLSPDPDVLIDKIKLIVFEKVRGNDNHIVSEQIVAIVDKLLQQECITTNQRQNSVSAFTS